MINKKLKQLGVECKYDPQTTPLNVHYAITIPEGLGKPEDSEDSMSLKIPLETKEHLTNVVDAIVKDLSKKDCWSLSISIDKEDYLFGLGNVASECRINAVESKRKSSSWDHAPMFSKIISVSGLIGGGLTGLVLGYGPSAECATDVAEYFNNISYLWAPITGLTQASISILGTAFSTAIGAGIGALGSELTLTPYKALKWPRGKRIDDYEHVSRTINHMTDATLNRRMDEKYGLKKGEL